MDEPIGRMQFDELYEQMQDATDETVLVILDGNGRSYDVSDVRFEAPTEEHKGTIVMTIQRR